MFYALSEQLEIFIGERIHHFELRCSLVQYLREHPKQVSILHSTCNLKNRLILQMYPLFHIQVKCQELFLEHFQGFYQEKKSVCVIYEVEVDAVKKDNLSLYHYNVFLSCFSCCNRTTVESIMLMNLFIFIHSN